MIMTYEWAEITAFADELGQMILQSEQADLYRAAYASVYNDKNLADEIQAFARLKDQYEEVQRFGKYHPEYSRVMKQIRVDKRRLDLNEKVANLRLAENELQDLMEDRKSTRLNSSHVKISYAVFCLKKKMRKR